MVSSPKHHTVLDGLSASVAVGGDGWDTEAVRDETNSNAGMWWLMPKWGPWAMKGHGESSTVVNTVDGMCTCVC